jgi:hypothetical protein
VDIALSYQSGMVGNVNAQRPQVLFIGPALWTIGDPFSHRLPRRGARPATPLSELHA